MVVRNDDSGATFSPDGKRMAFVRTNDPEPGKFSVLTANTDGTDEKIVTTGPDRLFPQRWSHGHRMATRSLWSFLVRAKPGSRFSYTTWIPRKCEPWPGSMTCR